MSTRFPTTTKPKPAPDEDDGDREPTVPLSSIPINGRFRRPGKDGKHGTLLSVGSLGARIKYDKEYYPTTVGSITPVIALMEKT